MLRLAAVAGVLVLVSCNDGPTSPPQENPTTPPAALRVEVLEDAVVSGQAFPVTVEALDGAGVLDAAWGGTVTLTASAGTLSPASVELVDGAATVEATLSAAGSVTLTAAAPRARARRRSWSRRAAERSQPAASRARTIHGRSTSTLQRVTGCARKRTTRRR
ncbi:MAG TPA: hypothetical protein VFQ22_01565 [Longimicrobiales bacterium]|nr:hypothetical protein [Longimicrobiales bacterium]